MISREELDERATTVVAEAVAEEAGVHLQRTSPTMAGIFVRGLTGNKVNVFVDGVRYSNAAQRGGVNTFLDLIDQSVVDGIEVVHGPNSAEYGSDALGGTVQFLTRTPALSAGGTTVGGEVALAAQSAHQGGGGSGARVDRPADLRPVRHRRGTQDRRDPARAAASTRMRRSRASSACPRRG